MMKWFRRAAPWQRLWLLATLAALAAGFVVLAPMVERARLDQLAEERARVVADFDRPECQPIRATPYSQLAPVPKGAPCHEIYMWRRNVTEKLPLVLTNVLFPMDAHRREIWFAGVAKAIPAVALLSAMLYALLFALYRRRS